MLPLYQRHGAPRKYDQEMHAGLWYDKFCNQWSARWSLSSSEGNNNPKQNWLTTLDGKWVGQQTMLEEWDTRQQQIVEARGGGSFLAYPTSRFVTGLGRNHPVENGFTFHPSLGVPYIPGTGLKGVLRSWLTFCLKATENANHERRPIELPFQEISEESIDRMLGQSSHRGSILFLDALPLQPVRLECDIMTPHVGPYYQSGEPPADWHKPVPVPYLTAAADSGTSFRFSILPVNPHNQQSQEDLKLVLQQLQQALLWIGVGAKTAAGHGRFSVVKK